MRQEKVEPEMIAQRDEFIRLVCDELNVPAIDVMSKKRDARTSMARHIIMWAMHRYSTASSMQIGCLMGRDHASVLYGIGAVESNMLMPYHKELRKVVEHVKAKGEVLQCAG